MRRPPPTRKTVATTLWQSSSPFYPHQEKGSGNHEERPRRGHIGFKRMDATDNRKRNTDRSFEMDDAHFDAVIVGSGFGGSVTAYRMAEAGLRVCLLERGKAYPPNSFPRAPHRMQKNFWDPSEGLYGMFNIWSFDELGAVVCSGLGGGSLIYANVLIRKDPKTFVKEDVNGGGYEYWPVSYEDLEPHYERVEKMLGAQRYPLDREPYNETRKTKEYEAAAKRLGLDWRLPNLAVTFGNEGEDPVPGEPIWEAHPNLHGRTRYTCRLVGECDFGCNYGSKNTLDYNYLSEAKRLGADIRTDRKSTRLNSSH